MRLILTASRAYRYAPWGKFNFCIPGISADVRRRRLEVAGVEMGVDKGMLGCRPLFNGLRTFLAALVTGRCVSAAKNIIKTLPLYLHNATTIEDINQQAPWNRLIVSREAMLDAGMMKVRLISSVCYCSWI